VLLIYSLDSETFFRNVKTTL